MRKSEKGGLREMDSPDRARLDADLTIRTTLFGAALSFGGLAVSQSGLTGSWLVASMTAAAAVCFLGSLFWPWLSGKVGIARRITTLVAQSVRAKFWARAVLLLTCIIAVYVIVDFASRDAANEAPAASIATPAPSEGDDAPATVPPDTPVREAYIEEFENYLAVVNQFAVGDIDQQHHVIFDVRRIFDFDANVDFFLFYIPSAKLTWSIARHIAEDWEWYLRRREDLQATKQPYGELTIMGEGMIFAGVVYLYTEDALTLQQMAELQSRFHEKGVSVHFRHPGTLRPEKETP